MNVRQLSVYNRYVLTLAIIGALTAFLAQMPIDLGQFNIALLYLLAVLISATTFGRGPAIFGSLLAFLCSNFFFVEPHYTLNVRNPQDVLQLVIFFIVAIVSSELAGRVRNQATMIAERARELTVLYSLSQAISADVDLERILPVIAQTACDMAGLPACRILLYDIRGLRETRGAYGRWPHNAPVLDIPIRAGARILGILQVVQAEQQPLAPTLRERLGLIANQIALVAERARLAEEVGTTRSLAESDRLKSVLLSSVSHDLRTPLAVIKGAVTNLLDEDVIWDDLARRELLQSVNESTDRLDRLVGNVLEMSRIEAGALSQSRSWQDISELLELAVARMQPMFAQHPVQLDIGADLPLVKVNATQIDQALTNVLENAVKHTPDGTHISIRVARQRNTVEIVIEDDGPGIEYRMLARIFERFVRATDPERHAEGSGLGLAIAKGLIEAHGGQMWAEQVPHGGARFVMQLPAEQPQSTAAISTMEHE